MKCMCKKSAPLKSLIFLCLMSILQMIHFHSKVPKESGSQDVCIVVAVHCIVYRLHSFKYSFVHFWP